jgi:hypothetical protein
MQSRVERLRNPAPKKMERDNASNRKPRRHRDRSKDRNKGSTSTSNLREQPNDVSSTNVHQPRRRQQQQQQQQVRRRSPGEQQKERPPAPTTDTSVLPPNNNRGGPPPSPPGGLSHPEDLSERAAQLAARARELRNTVEIDNANSDDDSYQHAKLQNMYLASMQTTLEKMANE